MKIKTPIITTLADGIAYEEEGPYCELCKAHMGQYYNPNADYRKGEDIFVNPHGYESYGDNQCPNCGAEYFYNEGNVLKLTEEELQIIYKRRMK